MNNIINLLPNIQTLEKEIRKKEIIFQEEIAPLKNTLNKLKEINQACIKCEGTGKVYTEILSPFYGRTEIVVDTCPICNGSGLNKNCNNS